MELPLRMRDMFLYDNGHVFNMELPVKGYWEFYPLYELEVRYRIIKERDKKTGEWKSFVYRWPECQNVRVL